jgi:hypothetical protein
MACFCRRRSANRIYDCVVQCIDTKVLSSLDNLIPDTAGGEEASWSEGKHSARSSNRFLFVSKTLS